MELETGPKTIEPGSMSIDELWNNFSFQYAEKRQEYELEKQKLDNIDMTNAKMGRMSLVELNRMKEDCVKLEGCLEALILVRHHVLGLEPPNEEC